MLDDNWISTVSREEARTMPYVSLMAALNEINRPPGGKDSLRLLVQNTFLTDKSKVLHIGCNTGSSTAEIVHLAKCSAVGIDLSFEMIRTAAANCTKDRYSQFLAFQVADAGALGFQDEVFDLSFSAGSMAFVKDRPAAVRELIRVTRTWGFVADIVLYYRERPNLTVIDKINKEVGIKIEPWSLTFWKQLYEEAGLELFFEYGRQMAVASPRDVDAYSERLVVQSCLPANTHRIVIDRVRSLMSLFNENHAFLSWAILIFRKRDQPEQATLFGC
jgi:ubiquinone/menaquinone biosynthesis C-methylase UbiE